VAEPRRYILPVGRPMTTADGTFDGIAVATVTPESFRSFLGTLDIGKDGVITVLHPEGSVLFRIPSTSDPIGESANGQFAVRLVSSVTVMPDLGLTASTLGSSICSRLGKAPGVDCAIAV